MSSFAAITIVLVIFGVASLCKGLDSFSQTGFFPLH